MKVIHTLSIVNAVKLDMNNRLARSWWKTFYIGHTKPKARAKATQEAKTKSEEKATERKQLLKKQR